MTLKSIISVECRKTNSRVEECPFRRGSLLYVSRVKRSSFEIDLIRVRFTPNISIRFSLSKLKDVFGGGKRG